MGRTSCVTRLINGSAIETGFGQHGHPLVPARGTDQSGILFIIGDAAGQAIGIPKIERPCDVRRNEQGLAVAHDDADVVALEVERDDLAQGASSQ
jgi:hypothetical protein